MITLDYRTNNARWGLRGIKFKSWGSYSFTLGYLSNLDHYHYYKKNRDNQNASLSICIERNNEQGAWEKEGRIQYYGSLSSLQKNLEDLYACSSAGNGTITKRINSNGYVLSLIKDYGFEVRTSAGLLTAKIYPSSVEDVKSRLRSFLIEKQLPDSQITACIEAFTAGFNV